LPDDRDLPRDSGVTVTAVTTLNSSEDAPEMLRLADLKPYLSITVLRCASDDDDIAFDALQRFLRKSAADPGRAVATRVSAQTPPDVVAEHAELRQLGFSRLYGISRVVRRVPGWTTQESGVTDTVNQLTIAVQLNKLVAIFTDITSPSQFKRWIHRQAAPFRFVPTDVIATAFRGDGKRLWTRGVHRRRTTKADSKALGGKRLQDALDPLEDGTFTLSAATIDFQPDDEHAVLRGNITYSGKSRVASRPTQGFTDFLAATAESLDRLAKSLTDGDEPEPAFTQLAVVETDLSRVRGAYDVLLAGPDEIRGEPGDDDQLERAESLRDVLLEVRAKPDSATALVDVGRGGSVAGTLALTPVEDHGGFRLDVRYAGSPTAEAIVREIREDLQDSDLLTVYYESGHAFTAHGISKINLPDRPFPNLDFQDFTGYEITREKPDARGDQAIHDAIGRDGDNSLFAWVVAQLGCDWLLCDDGAGEIADFLHLDNKGTLTAIHVKAAGNKSADRRIAVTKFEQVVSQAEKNVGLLESEELIRRLSEPRIAQRAAWHNGERVPAEEFVQQLHTRVASDKTKVAILQPHLLESVYLEAQASLAAGHPNRDTYSLRLLANLLHSTRRTVTARWDDLTVIGCE
jgi:hypothetical protein